MHLNATILISLLLIGFTFLQCKESSGNDKKDASSTSTLTFSHFDEKISYCIGLDHGLGVLNVYGIKQNEDKFIIAEIQQGLTDYLSDASLRVPIQNVDNLLEQYLLPNGEVNQLAVGKEDASYAVGISEAQYLVDALVGRGIDQVVFVDFLIKGINDGLNGNKPAVEINEARNEIKAYYTELTKEQGELFLANNKTGDSIQVTNSGLQYKVVKKGSGLTPRLTDTCVVHYTGRFIDGRVFESTIPSSIPGQFTPLTVIEGWKEALLMMKEGAQWRLFIPYDIAYGIKGSGIIEPYSTLVFDLELLKVKPYAP